jgi:hypothetical protein
LNLQNPSKTLSELTGLRLMRGRRLAVSAAWPGGIGDAINGVEEASDAGRIDYRGGAHPPPRSPHAPRLVAYEDRLGEVDQKGARHRWPQSMVLRGEPG